MRGQVHIDQMYAYIVMDDDDTEGIPAFMNGNTAMPMVGADMDRIASLDPIAQQLATEIGKKITLVRFSVREEVKVIDP